MPTIRSCLLLAALPALLPAQNVTATLSAITPLTVTTPAGTQSVGPGPLASGQLSTSNPGDATVDWWTSVSGTAATFELGWLGNGAARLGPSELLLTIAVPTAPQAVPLRFEGRFEQLTFGGFLQFGVDIGNDGTVDWQFAPGSSPLVVGGDSPDVRTQPIVLRVIVDYQQSASPGWQQAFRFRLVASRGGVFVQRLATSCDPGFSHYAVGADLETFPTTLTGDLLRLVSNPSSSWHIVGLSPQPTLLPPSLTLTTQPCLVIPAPDLVIRTGTLFLGVPAAAGRPIVLHSQLINLVAGNGLRASDSYQIVLL
jgi:hypothetical protein